MAMSNRLSSSNRSLLVLVIALLLAGTCAKAQNRNTNSAASPSPSPSASPSSSPAASPSPSTSPTPSPSPSVDLKTKLVESTWYQLVVSVIFGGLLVGFAATIMRVILRSKSSFRSPLGLPDGSLRAVLAFLLVAFLGFYVYASVLSLTPFNVPESLLGIIGTVIGFYFGSRSTDAAGTTTTGRTGSVEGVVLDSSGSPAVGATIELSQGSTRKFTQTADLNGKYDFDNVPIGDYDIQASKSGSTPSDTAKVKVAAGGTQTVNLKLK